MIRLRPYKQYKKKKGGRDKAGGEEKKMQITHGKGCCFFSPNVRTLRIEDIVGLITDVRSPVCIKPSATPLARRICSAATWKTCLTLTEAFVLSVPNSALRCL